LPEINMRTYSFMSDRPKYSLYLLYQ